MYYCEYNYKLYALNHYFLFCCVNRELTELRKTNALSQSAAQEATASAQLVAKEELRKELDEQRLKGEREKDALVLQVGGDREGLCAWEVSCQRCTCNQYTRS